MARRREAARAQVFAQAARDGTLIAAAHLQFPASEHLRASLQGRIQYVPINYLHTR